MLTRIYGVAFSTKQELDDYLKMMEEAEKRDPSQTWQGTGTFYDFRRSRQRFAVMVAQTALLSAENWKIICIRKNWKMDINMSIRRFSPQKTLRNFRPSRPLQRRYV